MCPGGVCPRGVSAGGVSARGGASQHVLGRGVWPSACWDTPPGRQVIGMVKKIGK